MASGGLGEEEEEEGERPKWKRQLPGPRVAAAAPLSFAQARALLHSPYSCLVLDTRRRHLALSPMYLQRKRTGIERQLRTELLRFSESFQGVPIAYDEVKLVGELGSIYDEQGYIHVNIEANFVIFKPEKGQKLVGVVNKVAPSHLGCVVHGCFNASIPKPYHENGTWPGFEVKVGNNLQFEVVHLDADVVGVLCIRGKLDPNSVQAEYNVESEKTLENNSNETPLENGNNHTADQTPGKKKKKKKKKHKRKNDEEFSTQDTPEEASETVELMDLSLLEDGVHKTNGKKSKKKKKKRAKEEKPNAETEIQTNDSCDKPTKKKKRKHSERASEPTDCTPEPKVKKRRKQ
uniref:DNA-directed RNA polymerase subunit n=1 Tax=Callorhinchus milii TaxID=7868 RepID=A0A4W3HBA7_CALMI|eukprot:gi/632963443/ref/XP_007897888.1/ PREDICTED: DNA-directed RNA polymerase I subunit RPA43 [Callorhinchus milii]